jgi:hypothetical protein
MHKVSESGDLPEMITLVFSLNYQDSPQIRPNQDRRKDDTDLQRRTVVGSPVRLSRY